MIERLEAIEKKYLELQDELMKPEVFSDIKKATELNKEVANLKEAYDVYQEYKKVLSGIEDAKEMVKDPELGEMAREELNELTNRKNELESGFEILLLPKDPNDGKDVIMEIRGAAGGDEANIFAGDLFRMYTRYAEKQGFKYEVYNSVDGEAGGFV